MNILFCIYSIPIRIPISMGTESAEWETTALHSGQQREDHWNMWNNIQEFVYSIYIFEIYFIIAALQDTVRSSGRSPGPDTQAGYAGEPDTVCAAGCVCLCVCVYLSLSYILSLFLCSRCCMVEQSMAAQPKRRMWSRVTALQVCMQLCVCVRVCLGLHVGSNWLNKSAKAEWEREREGERAKKRRKNKRKLT